MDIMLVDEVHDGSDLMYEVAVKEATKTVAEHNACSPGKALAGF